MKAAEHRQQAADRLIGAAQALERAAARLRERARWSRKRIADPPIIDHVDWGRADLENGVAVARAELQKGER